MKIREKNVILTKNYIINLTILLLAFGGMLRRSFNADTISHMLSPDYDVSFRLMHGRYLTGLVNYLLGQLGLRTTDHTGVTVLLGLILMALSVSVIQEMFRKFLNLEGIFENFAYLTVTGLIYVNVLASELMMFSEFTIFFGASFCLATVGAWYFIKQRYFLFLIYLSASCMFYQTGIIFCAILVSLYLFLDSKGLFTKAIILRQAGVLISVMAVGLANILSVRVLVRFVDDFYVIKTFNDSHVDNINTVVRHIINLHKNSLNLLPSLWLPLLFSLIMILVVAFIMIKKKDYQALIYFLLLQIGFLFLIYSISLLGGYPSPPPRMIFIFYLTQVTMAIIAFIYSNELTKKLLSYIFIAYLFIHIFFAQIIVTQHFVSNTLDKLYANMVYAKIVEYEEQTGITVTKLSVARDADSKLTYDEVSYTSYNINERVIGILNWLVVEMVSGRSFERLVMEKDFFDEYFGDKDWLYIDLSEQLIIMDDTAYWVIF